MIKNSIDWCWTKIPDEVFEFFLILISLAFAERLYRIFLRLVQSGVQYFTKIREIASVSLRSEEYSRCC